MANIPPPPSIDQQVKLSPEEAALIAEYHAIVVTPPWVQVVHNAVTHLTLRNRSKWSADLPYCLHATSNAEARCLVNRHYKTVGSEPGATWSDYDAAVGCHVSRAHFEALRRAKVVTDQGYFFNDSCTPSVSTSHLKEYRRKMQILLAPWMPAGSKTP